ncbi:DNA repair protein RecN [Actinomyces urogenitalis DSM 15434]|uniref:DNA repair protein RecN n=2 Tax=Actinomyces urogenitalis TaxID=103621 RepID=C0W409_9ACTO|nr:DNA repair protein RecN [Actinomyces urogenitalis]ETJ02976.1 MAG: DNA repair protein RecN [Actinomyces urogenitalis DORA_12]EEH66536.1 DNA repair protein RecN [Actinomyces urogenitalis DSM 15434]MBS6073108.1 DNA repair protein RecN [Actinomyces urogenitalis]MDK8236842.1 DNA repair protein RecN [Actinomyces urogenitalis]MDK8835544.1 DNA repair protein RecN [Actinomyces urogenitalis]
MIESLRIEDLGVIEEAELTLSPGLTALTGETGAGKTMVLTSLGLLLGERAESTVVRAGADRTVVEGSFVLDQHSRAAARAQEAGAELDEDLLIASRTVPAQGRSRAYLGGRSVPSAVLSEVGAELVSVHGQADQLRLRSAAAQRSALDSLGGAEHLARCRSYAQAYRAYQDAAQRLRQWREGAAARAEEVARLRGWLEAIEELDPAPGEDVALTEEATRLDHAEDLRRAAAVARTALAGDDDALAAQADALSLLAEAERAIAPVAEVDKALGELGARVERLSIEAADVAAELGEYLAGLDADPARLAWVQDRRGELARACREIGGAHEEIEDADALLAFAERAAARLEVLDGPTDTGSALSQEVEQARELLYTRAGELSAARAQLAELLRERVTSELEGLQMKGSRLVVVLDRLDEPGPTGAESVTLQLVSHPGAPALPLGKGASGGELSRIMLALEVVLAEASTDGYRRTLVFDEIDAGVGGRAAGEIGRRLARLARSHQVVVVTHLAQVAAWADTQLVVRKEQAQDSHRQQAQASNGVVPGLTRTTVLPVNGPERVRELARMLSGHDDSDSALRHAAELLEEAHVAESQP